MAMYIGRNDIMWLITISPIIFRALLFISHGFAEHCLFYEDLAKRFNDEGLLVFAHDHSK